MKKWISYVFGAIQKKDDTDRSAFAPVPNELVEYILSSLSDVELCNARLVCKRWNKLIIYSLHARYYYQR